MELLICLVVFVLVILLVEALYRSFSKYDAYQNRLATINSNSNSVSVIRKRNQFLNPTALAQKASGLFAPRSLIESIQAELISAGIPLRSEEYISLCVALIVLLPILLYFLSHNVWVAIVTIICGTMLPRVYIKHKQEARLKNLNHQLGDALVVMANALRAGFGFQQAMDTVRRELPPPISTEFTWTLQEMNLGFSHEEALVNLGQRVKSQDLDMVITAIIIQRQVGGNLAEILDNISSTIRDRAKIKQEIKILTAQGKLSGLIIGLLPVILIAVMLMINPKYFNVMITDIRGIVVLVAAGILELFGIFIIRKIIDINW